ncbi:hypothetical protein AYL99_02699 [Fonsecaea erecta]|uniref:Uncharacterized protein n=1 Tax=Fonsecaea erecta TaxID=1367422 RepID=A0A178ZUU9_9EURO|nr:hypothetical protein AYL99_02699 [Fonsecaea erecta]OAP63472.1 hypothetical protein AYL99_02699 [Fonsecaea erecta]
MSFSHWAVEPCISAGTPKSFRDSEHEAWAYFDITVSVQSGLMYQKTSLQAVQIFALKTVFAQGVGGPQPEYIYCAIAVRLATGLGLHKSSSKAWNLSDLDMEDLESALSRQDNCVSYRLPLAA